jgi:hypothetical protein
MPHPIASVRKRDGRVEPFDAAKIAAAIARAARAAGHSSRPVAGELADVVCLFLEKRFPGRIVRSRDILDVVDQVLRETGHGRVAEAARLYETLRCERRRRLTVRRSETQLDLFEDFARPVVESGRGAAVSPWDRRRIAIALGREAALDAAVADDVARAVEERVLRSGIERVSTGLVRELVNAELFERGLTRPLARAAMYGLPRADIENLIAGLDASPEEIERSLAAGVLRQYALHEVLSPAVSADHRVGRIHVAGLGRIARLFSIRVPSARNPARRVSPAERAESVREAVSRAEGAASHAVVVDGLGEAFGDDPAGPRAAAALVDALLHDARAKLTVDWVLAGPGAAAIGPPMFEAAARPARPNRFIIMVDEETALAPALITAACRAAGRGVPVVFRFVRPGNDGFRQFLAPHFEVSVNLAACAFRAGVGRYDAFVADAAEAVDRAAAAVADRAAFLLGAAGREMRASAAGDGAARGGPDMPCGVIRLAGLAEAMAVASPAAADLAEGVHAAHYLAATLHFRMREISRERRLLLALADAADPRVLRTLFARDIERFPDLARTAAGGAYLPGLRLRAEPWPVDPERAPEIDLHPLVEGAALYVPERLDEDAAGRVVRLLRQTACAAVAYSPPARACALCNGLFGMEHVVCPACGVATDPAPMRPLTAEQETLLPQ